MEMKKISALFTDGRPYDTMIEASIFDDIWLANFLKNTKLDKLKLDPQTVVIEDITIEVPQERIKLS